MQHATLSTPSATVTLTVTTLTVAALAFATLALAGPVLTIALTAAAPPLPTTALTAALAAFAACTAYVTAQGVHRTEPRAARDHG